MNSPISVHTVEGVAIADFPGDTTISVNWTRERNEVSKATIVIESQDESINDLTPWLHWITVWDCEVPAWTGVIQKVTLGFQSTTIECRDVSTFMWRTRTPLSRNYTQLDPAGIAEQLWQLMLELHRVKVKPEVFLSVQDRTFDFTVDADVRMLHQTMDDLVKLGLDWTVVGGRPILGTLPLGDPVAQLQDSDFMVNIDLMRDGTGTANDVRLQGANYAETARVRMGDLHLQTLLSIDDMFGVSNIGKATAEYTQRVARIPTVLVIPPGASLHPDVPWELREMVPGAIVSVYGRGVLSSVRLEQLEVNEAAGQHEVKVTLESVTHPVELEQQEASAT